MRVGRFVTAAMAAAMAIGAGAFQPLLRDSVEIREAKQAGPGRRKVVEREIGRDEVVHVYKLLKADTPARIQKLQRDGFEIIDVREPVAKVADRLLPRGIHVIKRVPIIRTTAVSLSKTYKPNGRREVARRQGRLPQMAA